MNSKSDLFHIAKSKIYIPKSKIDKEVLP
jgi:hypothetical protein